MTARYALAAHADRSTVAVGHDDGRRAVAAAVVGHQDWRRTKFATDELGGNDATSAP